MNAPRDLLGTKVTTTPRILFTQASPICFFISTGVDRSSPADVPVELSHRRYRRMGRILQEETNRRPKAIAAPCCGRRSSVMPYTTGGKQSTQRASARENGDTMISSGNLSKLGLLFVVTLMRFSEECMSTSFNLGNSSYICAPNVGSTLICYGDANQYHRNRNGSISGNADGSFAGKLSLVDENIDQVPRARASVAYYNQAIRMLDPPKHLVASFNTTFAFAQIANISNKSGEGFIGGDGMAFVISSNNGPEGGSGASLGYFDFRRNNTGMANKSVVVEFDNFFNEWVPSMNLNDIGWNHVAFDIGNEFSVTSQFADSVNILLWDKPTVHAWVEYSAETQQLELRISNTTSRPRYPLLRYKMDLFDVADEYMWVGFSASTGDYWSYYYVWNWTFESWFTTPPSSESRGTENLIIGLSVGLPVLVAVIVGFCLLVLARRRFRRRQAGQLFARDALTRKLASKNEGYRFTYEQLRAATGGFPETAKLGRGGFGSVFRGVLPDCNAPIAVKRIDAESGQGEKEFMAEVSTISQLRHRNLIQLLGWCTDRGRFIIVYELMPHGSLDQLLFHPQSVLLSWSQRYSILRGTAAAVDYLHQGWNQRVIHRDIKASNIMLDDEWNAKLGDFGLARLVDHLRTPATTGIAGTVGYIAPEVPTSGKFTEKTDTFAFGTVAIEVATGRKAWHAPDDEMFLVDWVWQRLSEGKLLTVVDERLGDDFDTDSMEVVLRMGILCCHPNPLARPPMRQVVQVLAGDALVPSVPLSKPAPVFLGLSNHSSYSIPTDGWSSHSSVLRSSVTMHSSTHSTENSIIDSNGVSVTPNSATDANF